MEDTQLAPGNKDTVDETKLFFSSLPQQTSTGARTQNTLTRLPSLDDNFNNEQRFSALKNLIQPLRFNENESLALDTASFIEDPLKDQSSLGLIDLNLIKDTDLSLNLIDLNSANSKPTSQESISSNSLKLAAEELNCSNDNAKQAETYGENSGSKSLEDLIADFKRCKAKYTEKKTSIISNFSSTNADKKSLDLFDVNSQGSGAFFKQFNELPTKLSLGKQSSNDVFNKENMPPSSSSLVSAADHTNQPIVPTYEDEESLVFQDDNGEFVTSLAFHCDFNNELGDQQNFSSEFQQAGGVMSANEALDMFKKDEEVFIKESKLKINNNAVASNNDNNSADNSWAVTSEVHDITRPSWLSPPTGNKSYMRISIGQFMQAKTEALGSLEHQEGIERPHFGTAVFSPPQNEDSIIERSCGSIPLMTKLEEVDKSPEKSYKVPLPEPKQPEVGSSKNDQADIDTLGESSIMETDNVPNYESYSTISRLLKDASINADPKVLAAIILNGFNKPATKEKSVLGDTTDTYASTSVHNWLNASATVSKCSTNPISPINIPQFNYSRKDGSNGNLKPEPSSVLRNGCNEMTANVAAADNFKVPEQPLSCDWKEPRISSVYSENKLSSYKDILEKLPSDNGTSTSLGSLHQENINAKTSLSSSKSSVSSQIIPNSVKNTTFKIKICDELRFSNMLCVGVSSNADLELKNTTPDWLNCSFKIIGLYLNGQEVDMTKMAFKFNDQVCFSPQGEEKLKIVAIPNDVGDFKAIMKLTCLTMSSSSSYENNSIEIPILASAEAPKVKTFTNDEHKLSFGMIPDGCTKTQSFSLFNLGKSSLPLRLRINNNNFKFVTTQKSSSRSEYCDIMSVTLDGHRRQSVDVNVACQAKFSQGNAAQEVCHVVGDLSVELDTPSANCVEVCKPVFLAADVGMVKLHIKFDSEPLVLKSNIGEETKYDVHLKNSGKIPLHIKADIQNENLQVVPSEVALYPSQQGYVTIFLKAQYQPITLNSMLLFTVLPNGHVYEIQILAKINESNAGLVHLPHAESQLTKARIPPWIESNRSRLCWHAVPLGSSANQKFVLRNSSVSEGLVFKAYIKGSAEFQFAEKNSVRDFSHIVLGCGQELPVYVTYATKTVAVSNAKIILEPQGNFSGLKSSINLSAYSGASKLNVKGIESLDILDSYRWALNAGKMTDHIKFQVPVCNSGGRSMFVSILLFSDLNCKQVVPSNEYSIEPDKFVLSANKTKNVEIRMMSKRSCEIEHGHIIGYLMLLSGDEIIRHKLRAALKNGCKPKSHSSKQEIPDFIRSLNFQQTFHGETSYHKEVMGYPEDINAFYTSINKMPVVLYAKNTVFDLQDISGRFSMLKTDDIMDSMYSQNYTLQSEPSDQSVLSNYSTSHSPPARDYNPNKIVYKDRGQQWTVSSKEIHLSASSNQFKSAIDIFNHGLEFLRYELTWPRNLLTVSSSDGQLFPKSSTRIEIQKNGGLVLNSDQVATIKIHCNQRHLDIAVHLQADQLSNEKEHLNKHLNINKSKSSPLSVCQNVMFEDTAVSDQSKYDFEMFNASFHQIKWTFSPSPTLFKNDDKSEFLKLPINFFEFSQLSGILEPRQKCCIDVAFRPHFQGIFKQIWILNALFKNSDEFVINVEVNGQAVATTTNQDPLLKSLPAASKDDEVQEKQNKYKHGRVFSELSNFSPKTYRKASDSDDGQIKSENIGQLLSLSSECIQFPSTAPHKSSTVKVKIKNTSKTTYHVQISTLSQPFHVNHSSLKVQPKCYISLPVFFRPTNAGSFTSTLLVKCDSVVLTAKLHGVAA